MIFEWDERKNRANIRKHGLDFANAEQLFRDLLVADPDTREDYGEKRWNWNGHDTRTHLACGLCGTAPRDNSHHFPEKGNRS
jgi:uncharacterized DUF497 family protein